MAKASLLTQALTNGGTGAIYGDSFVFPRVSHVRAWIDDHMKNTQFCKFAGNSDQPINK